MTTNPITHRQAKALAALIHELRGDWDTPGILDILGRARDTAPGPDLAIAAIRAAGSAHNRTPAVIALDGPHWRGSDTPPRHQTPAKSETCSACYERKDVCRSRWDNDHEFVPLTEATARRTLSVTEARAALAAAKADCCSHGVPRTACRDHHAAATDQPDQPDQEEA